MQSTQALGCSPWGRAFGGREGHHHHHHHHGRGPGFWAMARQQGGPFGFGPPEAFMRGWGGGHGRGGGRGRRARRGDVRAALLLLLAEEPRNGYQLIQEISARSDEVWTPSPGSVYPALQQLEDEGLVRAREVEGRRAFELTDEGRSYVDVNREQLGEPWAAVKADVDEGAMELRTLMMQVGAAVVQTAASGHGDEAKRILTDTRRALYKVLAEDGAEEGSGA